MGMMKLRTWERNCQNTRVQSQPQPSSQLAGVGVMITSFSDFFQIFSKKWLFFFKTHVR
jgi:hypothetical protein